MKANRFFAKVMAITMVFAAAGAVLPNTVTRECSITASAGIDGLDKAHPIMINDYKTLKDAFRKAPEGEKLYLQLGSDVTLDGATNLDVLSLSGYRGNVYVYLDLNGHRLYRKTSTFDKSMFEIGAQANLIISDSVGTGEIWYINTHQDVEGKNNDSNCNIKSDSFTNS